MTACTFDGAERTIVAADRYSTTYLCPFCGEHEEVRNPVNLLPKGATKP